MEKEEGNFVGGKFLGGKIQQKTMRYSFPMCSFIIWLFIFVI